MDTFCLTLHDRYHASTNTGLALGDYELRLETPLNREYPADLTPLEIYEAIGKALAADSCYVRGKNIYFDAIALAPNNRI